MISALILALGSVTESECEPLRISLENSGYIVSLYHFEGWNFVSALDLQVTNGDSAELRDAFTLLELQRMLAKVPNNQPIAVVRPKNPTEGAHYHFISSDSVPQIFMDFTVVISTPTEVQLVRDGGGHMLHMLYESGIQFIDRS